MSNLRMHIRNYLYPMSQAEMLRELELARELDGETNERTVLIQEYYNEREENDDFAY